MATDIATGWSESLEVITRDGASVLAAIQRLRQQLPFPLRFGPMNPEQLQSLAVLALAMGALRH